MAWITPKTDWYGETDSDGVYSGDRFDYKDFNRIKNNLQYLRDMAIYLYDEFVIGSVGIDRTPQDYFYADEINQLEQNLETINEKTLNVSYGSTPTYIDNGNIMDFIELNRLESATLDLYGKLKNQADGRRKFIWNFGMGGGL